MKKHRDIDIRQDLVLAYIQSLKAEKPAESQLHSPTAGNLLNSPICTTPSDSQQAQTPAPQTSDPPSAVARQDLASICKQQPIIREWTRSYLNSYYATEREAAKQQVRNEAHEKRLQISQQFKEQAMKDRALMQNIERHRKQKPTIEQPNAGPYDPAWA